MLVKIYYMRGFQLKANIPVDLKGEKLRLTQKFEDWGVIFLLFRLVEEDFSYKWVLIAGVSSLPPFKSGLPQIIKKNRHLWN